MVKAIVNVDPVSLIRLGLLLTLLLMTINLNNSASGSIPPSDGLCPLISWILISMVFILVALFEYFLILVLLRFGNKVSLLPGCVTVRAMHDQNVPLDKNHFYLEITLCFSMIFF